MFSISFSSWESLFFISAGNPFSEPSSGGELANVNMWSRLIPVEVMNTMMWQGNVYSMSSETVTLLSGDISRNTYTYNVSGKNVCLVVLSLSI